VRVESRFIAVFRASLRAKQVLEQARMKAREVVAANKAGKTAATPSSAGETPVPQAKAGL